MSSSYYASSSSFSQVNNETPKTSQKIFSMDKDNTENISGFYKQLENDMVIKDTSFNSLEGLKKVLLEYQNNQHQLRDTYKQTLTNSHSLSGGNMQNIFSPLYKKNGGTLKPKTNPIEKINPNEIIAKQNYIRALY